MQALASDNVLSFMLAAAYRCHVRCLRPEVFQSWYQSSFIFAKGSCTRVGNDAHIVHGKTLFFLWPSRWSSQQARMGWRGGSESIVGFLVWTCLRVESVAIARRG
ncbi:unnamed protein product [Cercospora beticola]|nr:unnamed protein product [Cercospora beticola]